MTAKESGNFARSIGVRMTTETLERVRQKAAVAGQKPSIWMRNVVMDAVAGRTETRVILAEIMALRAVLLTAERDARQGANQTAEAFDMVVKQADARRFAMADGRIEKAVGQ